MWFLAKDKSTKSERVYFDFRPRNHLGGVYGSREFFASRV